MVGTGPVLLAAELGRTQSDLGMGDDLLHDAIPPGQRIGSWAARPARPRPGNCQRLSGPDGAQDLPQKHVTARPSAWRLDQLQEARSTAQARHVP